jgi:hypothetical protein
MSGGVRGKYANRFPRDVVVVTLASDVAAAFPDAEAVNQTQRELLRTKKKDETTSDETRVSQTVSLFPYERHSLESLRKTLDLDTSLVNDFGLILNRFAGLFGEIVNCSDRDFHAGRVVLMGLISHTHLLMTGGLQSLEVGNGSVWAACFRSLIEVFGALVLIEENPDRISNHLDHVKPGKLRAAAERACPGLGGDLDRLNSVVHPGPGAILSTSSTIVDPISREVNFQYGLRKPAQIEGREGLNCLANIAIQILHKVEALSRLDKVMTKGKIILRRNCEFPGQP